MANMGKQHARHGCNFRRLQHHGATGNQRGGHFAGDLVHRPVPRRDQRANADAFVHDACGAAHIFPRHSFRSFDRAFYMHLASPSLRAARPFDGGTHLGAHDLGEFLVHLVIGIQDALHQSDALGHGGDRPRRKGRFGRSDGRINIDHIAQSHLGHDLFGGGVFHAHPRAGMGGDPSAADVELLHMCRNHHILT